MSFNCFFYILYFLSYFFTNNLLFGFIIMNFMLYLFGQTFNFLTPTLTLGSNCVFHLLFGFWLFFSRSLFNLFRFLLWTFFILFRLRVLFYNISDLWFSLWIRNNFFNRLCLRCFFLDIWWFLFVIRAFLNQLCFSSFFHNIISLFI